MSILLQALLALAPSVQAPAVQSPAGAPVRVFDHALLVSVDGLRSDALLAEDAASLPAFARLRAGASTLNARTDPDFTVTLPNHTSMLTGRLVLGENGHGWVENDDAPEGMTLAKNKGAYVAGIFDVAHDRGFRTGMVVGKTKFSIYDVSWNAENGAPSTVRGGAKDAAGGKPAGDDLGRDKIDEYVFAAKTAEMADGVLRNLKVDGRKTLVFAHFAATDLTAHAYGWDVTPGSKYLKALASIDKELGRILDAVQADEALRGKTVVVLTADHGGGAPFKSHDQRQMWVDYVIPFLVWTGDGGEARDLYALNAATRKDPGITQTPSSKLPPDPAAGLPPIRNGDTGNLVLSLLGLPPIPGSTINAKQDLRIEAHP